MFGRTIRVNLAKPQKIKEGSTKPVWSEDSWLQEHAGKTLNNEPENLEKTNEDDFEGDKPEEPIAKKSKET